MQKNIINPNISINKIKMAHGIDPWYSPKWHMVLTHGIHLECSLFKGEMGELNQHRFIFTLDVPTLERYQIS